MGRTDTIKLTQSAVDNLQPADKACVRWNSELNGLS